MIENDDSLRLADAVAIANDRSAPLCIQGSGSKRFLGCPGEGSILSLADHRGIVEYRPEELYLTARCGTPISDIKGVLHQYQQRLPFDPPEFEGKATFGGAVAAGLAGPGRPWNGAVRDSMLGVVVVNGLGESLTFGGQVMKNVAGYDVTRLMAGAFGTLGVLLEASVKVLPEPELEIDCIFHLEREEALQKVIEFARSALPLSATCHVGGSLHVRFSGNAQGVNEALNDTAMEGRHSAQQFWNSLRDHSHEFFRQPTQLPLWRFSLPPAAPYPIIPAPFEADWLTEWAGAQRWLRSDAPGELLIELAALGGGYAECYFPQAESAEYSYVNLSPTMTKYHQRLKQVFDPNGVLNPHRISQTF